MMSCSSELTLFGLVSDGWQTPSKGLTDLVSCLEAHELRLDHCVTL